jgi:hypothetical protein
MQPADIRPHPAPSSGQDAALDKLAAELRVRGYQAHLIAPDGRPPSLAVTNPHATALTETVMADTTSFWWPVAKTRHVSGHHNVMQHAHGRRRTWADRIAAVADVAGAADVIARVLAAVPGDGPA